MDPERISKPFAVFDCDAHINDPVAIWDYVPESERELVRATYWRDEEQAWLNATTRVNGGGSAGYGRAGMFNPICIGGPQMRKEIIRRLIQMVPLDDAQREYLECRGATDPHERLRDLDLMGIDQVLVIPTKVIEHLPYAEDPRGAAAFCRAYNDFVRDWCDTAPERLFPAALLPLQDPQATARELRRAASRGFPVGLLRPIDAQGCYPNDVGAPTGALQPGAAGAGMDPVFRAFEETGIVLGVPSFPASRPASSRSTRPSTRRPSPSCSRATPGSRRCCSPACSTATPRCAWPSSSRTRSGCRRCSSTATACSGSTPTSAVRARCACPRRPSRRSA